MAESATAAPAPPEARTRVAYGVYKAKVRELLHNQNIAETVEFINSGQYAIMARSSTSTLQSYDLFVAVARGYNGTRLNIDYRLVVFDTFVRNRRVFVSPYRMVKIVEFLSVDNPFITIIASYIPRTTWAMMPREIFEHAPHTDNEVVRRQIMFCLYFGRRWLSITDLTNLERLYEEKTSEDSETIDFADEVGVVNQRGETYTADERCLLAQGLRRAEKRVCYEAMLDFAIGTIGLRLPVYIYVEMAKFAVPCFNREVMTQYEVVRMLQNVRQAYEQVDARMAEATATAVRAEYEKR